MLALLVGVIMIVAGVARLGFIADLLSRPTQIGYMNGLALTILIGQLPKLLGFSVDADGLIDEARGFVDGLVSGEAVVPAAAIGLLSLALIIGFQHWRPRIPGVLVAVLVAIAAAGGFNLGDHGVSLVGSLPAGLPSLTWPNPISDLPLLVAGALGIALVSLTDTISTASAFAARKGQEVNGNGEMIGIGAANIGAGLFQGFPVSTSGSRTAVADQAGAKTQLTGLVGAAAIMLMLVLAPGLLRSLPQATLAAVVIAASLSLADIAGVRRLWRQRRAEWLLSIAAFLGVALLGVLQGIGIAVALSILNIFRRAWWPYMTTLGRVPGMSGQHDRTLYPNSEQLPGLEVFRFDAPLFFANARAFRDKVRAPGGKRAAPALDRCCRRADHRCRHDGGRHDRRPRRGAERSRHLARLRRAQGPGSGAARALSADRPVGPGPLLPHSRRGRRRLPRGDRRGLEMIAGTRPCAAIRRRAPR